MQVRIMLRPENTHHREGSMYPAGLDCYQTRKFVAICVYWNYWIQTSQTGDQPNNDTSPPPYSECSLVRLRGLKARNKPWQSQESIFVHQILVAWCQRTRACLKVKNIWSYPIFFRILCFFYFDDKREVVVPEKYYKHNSTLLLNVIIIVLPSL